MTDSTNLTRDIKDCMERAGSPLSDDQFMLLAGYLAEQQSHTPSAAGLLEMADCLAECLRDLNEAIAITMRSGNSGSLTVNGQKLTVAQLSQRLHDLKCKRDRILRAIHQTPQVDRCTYPECQCRFDMGPDQQCLKGLPVIRK